MRVANQLVAGSVGLHCSRWLGWVAFGLGNLREETEFALYRALLACRRHIVVVKVEVQISIDALDIHRHARHLQHATGPLKVYLP
jgi:hypothetical protein